MSLRNRLAAITTKLKIHPERWIVGGVLLCMAATVLAICLVNGKPKPKSAPSSPRPAASAGTDGAKPASGNAATPAPSSASPPPASAGGTVAPAPTPPPPPTPASILGLANWRLTLPINTAHSGSPDEINQPELASFTMAPYFELTPRRDGVIFQAQAGGATTSGSKYPRSELREMTANGTTEASWSTASGTHTMTVREAITHLPTVKPEVVAAQVHDASDDVVMVKLSGTHLFVEANSKNIGDLDTNYALGTVYTVRIVASSGHIQVFFNDVLKVYYTHSGSGNYFKAGCYTQSNPSKGDTPDAYAQVILYSVQISHA